MFSTLPSKHIKVFSTPARHRRLGRPAISLAWAQLVCVATVATAAPPPTWTCPTDPTPFAIQGTNAQILEGVVVSSSMGPFESSSAGVAINTLGPSYPRFAVAFDSAVYTATGENGDYGANELLVSRFMPDGTCAGPIGSVSGIYRVGGNVNEHHEASIAMSASGQTRVGWGGLYFVTGLNGPFTATPSLLLSDFAITSSPATWPLRHPPDQQHATGDYECSVGISSSPSSTTAVGWSSLSLNGATWEQGLDYLAGPSGSPFQLRDCSTLCYTRVAQYQGCVASRDDGYYVMAWGEPESAVQEYPPFNIAIQLFDKDGNKIPSNAPLGFIVNQTTLEIPGSPQFSPAVAFEGNDIVVAWVGREPLGSPGDPRLEIFARCFRWTGGNLAPTPLGDQFIVNSDPNYAPHSWTPDYARPNPAVALSRAGNGKFIVAWNAMYVGETGFEGRQVRAQYFQGDRPLGGEFRVNQVVETENPYYDRLLARSGQHTIAYGPDDEVVCAWTRYGTEEPQPSKYAYFTLLPPGYAELLDAPLACCKGDMNGDGYVGGDDIQYFVNYLLAPPQPQPGESATEFYFAHACPADTNNDGLADFYDLECFVDLMFAGGCDPDGCPLPASRIRDCNHNGVDDAEDIASGYSQDCNTNGIPDECEIAIYPMWPPFGEPDCNGNGVPDECDIAEGNSPDCNRNGIPDECDLIAHPEWDCCPHDGIPDECALTPDSMIGQNACPPAEDTAAAWAAYFAWARQQTWGSASGIDPAIQQQMILDKLCELGLVSGGGGAPTQ